MDELERLEENCRVSMSINSWIRNHRYCLVYFNKCKICGDMFTSRSIANVSGFCSKTCRARNDRGTFTWRDDYIFGVRLQNKKVKSKGKTYVYERWVAQISENGKRKCVYVGKDFFEACCRRKSAEAKQLKGVK